jgi:hypothetical protein
MDDRRVIGRNTVGETAIACSALLGRFHHSHHFG